MSDLKCPMRVDLRICVRERCAWWTGDLLRNDPKWGHCAMRLLAYSMAEIAEGLHEPSETPSCSPSSSPSEANIIDEDAPTADMDYNKDFEAYGIGEIRFDGKNYKVAIQCGFEDTEEYTRAIWTELLCIVPDPGGIHYDMIQKEMAGQGPWLQDYVWSDRRVMGQGGSPSMGPDEHLDYSVGDEADGRTKFG